MNQQAEKWVTQFDNLVALHASVSDTAQNDGLHRLPLKKEPQRRILPKVFRSMGMVDPGMVDVFRELVSGQSPWPLYLHSPVGSGKTRAALCLCDFADTAAYWSVDSLCDFVMKDPPDDVRAEWGRLKHRSALAVLDEIGQRDKVGDLHATTLQGFLDRREQHAESVGIYISNIDPADLGGLYDDRIVSRLLAGTVHHLQGDDRRGK